MFTASHCVGLTLPGIIELPGSFEGNINSPIPAIGPQANHLMSFAILFKDPAQIRICEERLEIAFCEDNSSNLFLHTLKFKPVSSDINDGNFTEAMKNLKKALSISKRLRNKEKIAGVLRKISAVLEQKGDDNKSLKYQIEAKEIYSQIGNKFFEAITSRSIGITYEKIGKIDKAMEYFQVGYKINKTDQSNIINNNSWWFESNIGIILFKKKI